MAKTTEKEMPFLDHLEELRHRLFWILGSLVIGICIGLFLVLTFEQILLFLQAPVLKYLGPGERLVVLNPMDNIKIPMMAALILGIVIALPVVGYHIWAFLAPGLYANERKVMVPVLAAGGILFALGVVLCFRVVLPLSLRFLFTLGEQFFAQNITAQGYFGMAIGMSLAFGAMFEIPIVVLALTWLGVVTPQLLHRFRRYAIVILLVVCAFLTPPDIVSLSLMFAPIYLLYEGSVLLSFILYRKRERRIASEAQTET